MSFRGRGHTQQRGHGHTLVRFRGQYGRGRGSYGGGRAGGFTAPPHASGLNLLPSNGPNGNQAMLEHPATVSAPLTSPQRGTRHHGDGPVKVTRMGMSSGRKTDHEPEDSK